MDYDHVASAYDRRYDLNAYDGVRDYLHRFIASSADVSVLEAGCGTGHWLAELGSHRVSLVAGVDVAAAMLIRARTAAPGALLLRATASRLPFADETFDRIFCVNALHHFPDRPAFFGEAYRVLRKRGSFLSIGLDPHAGSDSWWIYDYFPAARRADEIRYRPTGELRASLAAAGFSRTQTDVAQQLSAEVPFAEARANGVLDRHSTSQLMVIADDEFATGIARIEAERPVLRADLRLYATRAEK